MKKIVFIFTAMLAMAQAQALTPDTVTVIEQPKQVVITETPTGTNVKITGSKDNEDYSYTYTMQHSANDTIHTTQSADWELNLPFMKSSGNGSYHWSLETKGIYFGAGLNSSCDLINNSFNWGILDIMSINYHTLHGQHFSLGVGFDSKRFSLKRPNCFVKDESTKVVYTDIYPEGASSRSSVLNVRAVQFPLLFQQDLGDDFHFVLGASMNWNAYAKCTTKYKENKVKTKLSYSNIKQNKITFDAIGGLSYNGLAVYVRYSPCDVFQKGFGPEIKNTWTLGGAISF